MIGGDGAWWLSTYVSREVLGSNPTGAVSNLGQVRYPTLLKSLRMLLVYRKMVAVLSRSQTKGGRRHSNVKEFPRWLLVSNSS